MTEKKKVPAIATDEDGFVMGEGPLNGWAFDATCKPKDRERTIRNAMLAFLRAQVDGNHTLGRAILNSKVGPNHKVYHAISSGLARYAQRALESIVVENEPMSTWSKRTGQEIANKVTDRLAEKARAEAVEEAKRCAARAVEEEDAREREAIQAAQAPPPPATREPVKVADVIATRAPRYLTREEVRSKLEGFSKVQGHRPRLVEHHQNGNRCFAWIWKQAFFAIEVESEGKSLRLSRLPEWAKRPGEVTPEYSEEAADTSYLPRLEPTQTERDMFSGCKEPEAPSIGEQLHEDLERADRKPRSEATRIAPREPVARVKPIQPMRESQTTHTGPLPGEAWLTRTLTETLKIGVARQGKTQRCCELCLSVIASGEPFTKGTTGMKRAHTRCFDKRAGAKR